MAVEDSESEVAIANAVTTPKDASVRYAGDFAVSNLAEADDLVRLIRAQSDAQSTLLTEIRDELFSLGRAFPIASMALPDSNQVKSPAIQSNHYADSASVAFVQSSSDKTEKSIEQSLSRDSSKQSSHNLERTQERNTVTPSQEDGQRELLATKTGRAAKPGLPHIEINTDTVNVRASSSDSETIQDDRHTSHLENNRSQVESELTGAQLSEVDIEYSALRANATEINRYGDSSSNNTAHEILNTSSTGATSNRQESNLIGVPVEHEKPVNSVSQVKISSDKVLIDRVNDLRDSHAVNTSNSLQSSHESEFKPLKPFESKSDVHGDEPRSSNESSSVHFSSSAAQKAHSSESLDSSQLMATAFNISRQGERSEVESALSVSESHQKDGMTSDISRSDTKELTQNEANRISHDVAESIHSQFQSNEQAASSQEIVVNDRAALNEVSAEDKQGYSFTSSVQREAQPPESLSSSIARNESVATHTQDAATLHNEAVNSATRSNQAHVRQEQEKTASSAANHDSSKVVSSDTSHHKTSETVISERGPYRVNGRFAKRPESTDSSAQPKAKSEEALKEAKEKKDQSELGKLVGSVKPVFSMAGAVLDKQSEDATDAAGTAAGGSYFKAAKELYEISQNTSEKFASISKKYKSDEQESDSSESVHSSRFARTANAYRQSGILGGFKALLNSQKSIETTTESSAEASSKQSESTNKKLDTINETVDKKNFSNGGNGGGLLEKAIDIFSGKKKSNGPRGKLMGKLGSIFGRSSIGSVAGGLAAGGTATAMRSGVAAGAGTVAAKTGLLGAAGKGIGTAAGKVGMRAIPVVGTAAMAAWDAYSGFNDQDLHKNAFNLSGTEKATTGQKVASSAANVLDLGGLITGAARFFGADVKTSDLASGLYSFFGGNSSNTHQTSQRRNSFLYQGGATSLTNSNARGSQIENRNLATPSMSLAAQASSQPTYRQPVEIGKTLATSQTSEKINSLLGRRAPQESQEANISSPQIDTSRLERAMGQLEKTIKSSAKGEKRSNREATVKADIPRDFDNSLDRLMAMDIV